MIRSTASMVNICLTFVAVAMYFALPIYADHPPAPSPLPHEASAPPGEDLPIEPRAPVEVFNVMDYGAVADGKTDSTLAFLSAWEEACAHPENSTVHVPAGTYLVGPVSFSGPCRNYYSPEFFIQGTLKAPAPISNFPSGNWVLFQDLYGLNLTGIAGAALLDGQGSEAWTQSSCHEKSQCDKLIPSLRFANVSHGTISNIALSDAKGFHIDFYKASNIRVQSVWITAPEDSPNTDGIHVSNSANISITSSTIGVGDDCISIGPGNTNISVSDVNCGPGHGISVGSLGKYPNEEKVEMIRVSNCKINGTQNGLRVKTWPASQPGEASNMVFEDIDMINVSNPIIIDQEYCPSGQCDIERPSLVKLSGLVFDNITGTYNSNLAVSLLCSPSVPCKDVLLSRVNLNMTLNEDPRAVRLSLKGLVQGLLILNSTF